MSAFDSIVKALTVQISVDDLTGGAWKTIGDGVKDAMNLATPFNQAWELSAKVIDKVAAAMEAPLEWLSQGGELAEARAGVESLGDSFGVNSTRILESIRTLSDGTMDVTQSIKATGDAIRMGFSEDQVETIWKFAQKYADTMGGDVLTIADKIETAIFTGKGKSAKDFGLNVAVGTSFDDIKKQMDDLVTKMGDGAFNFGEMLEKMSVSVKDSALAIKEQLNNIVGKLGFENFSNSFRDAFKSIENESFDIAMATFVPIKDAISGIVDLCGTLAEKVLVLVSGFGNFYDTSDLGFKKTDTAATKLLTTINTLGLTMYDVAYGLARLWNSTIGELDTVLKPFFRTQAGMLESYVNFLEWTGKYTKENLADARKQITQIKEWSKDGVFRMDVGGILEAQAKYKAALKETADAHVHLKAKVGETSDGVQAAGEAFGGMSKEAKAGAKDMEQLTKQIENAQISFARKMEDIETDHNKRVADIRAKELQAAKEHPEKLAAIKKEYAEKLAAEDARYARAKADATLDSKRKLEDIERAHGDKVVDINKSIGTTVVKETKNMLDELFSVKAATPTGKGNKAFVEWDVAKMSDAFKISGKSMDGGLDVSGYGNAISPVVRDWMDEALFGDFNLDDITGSMDELVQEMDAYTKTMDTDYNPNKGKAFTDTEALRLMESLDLSGMKGKGGFDSLDPTLSNRTKSGEKLLKVQLLGVDNKLKDFLEYLIDQIARKALAEGYITAGV